MEGVTCQEYKIWLNVLKEKDEEIEGGIYLVKTHRDGGRPALKFGMSIKDLKSRPLESCRTDTHMTILAILSIKSKNNNKELIKKIEDLYINLIAKSTKRTVLEREYIIISNPNEAVDLINIMQSLTGDAIEGVAQEVRATNLRVQMYTAKQMKKDIAGMHVANRHNTSVIRHLSSSAQHFVNMQTHSGKSSSSKKRSRSTSPVMIVRQNDPSSSSTGQMNMKENIPGKLSKSKIRQKSEKSTESRIYIPEELSQAEYRTLPQSMPPSSSNQNTIRFNNIIPLSKSSNVKNVNEQYKSTDVKYFISTK